MSHAYEQDFFSWTREQAAAVPEGNLGRMDREHLAGEIEEMGRSEQRALAERMAVIVAHLLKLEVQTERTPTNEKGWRNSVATQRRQIERLLAKNPGLRNPAILADALESAWDDGRDWAIRETGLDPEQFPSEPIYTERAWVFRKAGCVPRASGQGAPTRRSGPYGEEAQRRPGVRGACNAAKNPRALGI